MIGRQRYRLRYIFLPNLLLNMRIRLALNNTFCYLRFSGYRLMFLETLFLTCYAQICPLFPHWFLSLLVGCTPAIVHQYAGAPIVLLVFATSEFLALGFHQYLRNNYPVRNYWVLEDQLEEVCSNCFNSAQNRNHSFRNYTQLKFSAFLMVYFSLNEEEKKRTKDILV